jgi:hypothetical protein
MADDCSSLSLKINYLNHTIQSHIEWDNANPDPAYPAGRHAIEIADLTNAINNCKEIYTTKCTNQPRIYPVPVSQPSEAEEGAGATEGAEAAEGVEATEGAVEGAEVAEGAAEGLELVDLLELLPLLAL